MAFSKTNSNNDQVTLTVSSHNTAVKDSAATKPEQHQSHRSQEPSSALSSQEGLATKLRRMKRRLLIEYVLGDSAPLKQQYRSSYIKSHSRSENDDDDDDDDDDTVNSLLSQ